MVTVENVLTIIQVVICGLMLILTPLKAIPNDIENNKVLGILGLITFAFLFISAFFLSKYDKKNEHEKQMERNAVSNYYLNLMKKMTEEKEHKDATND